MLYTTYIIIYTLTYHTLATQLTLLHMIGGQNQSIAGQPQLLILESDASYYNVIVHL